MIRSTEAYLSLALAIAVTSSNATAAEKATARSPSGALVMEPDWQHKPSGEDVANAYPKIAATLQIDGYSLLHCNVSPEGQLFGCRVVLEAPTELGFGAAALSLTRRFRMSPKLVDGQPQASELNIPIHFKMPGREPWADPASNATPKALELSKRLVARRMRAASPVEPVLRGADAIEFTSTDPVPDATKVAAAQALRTAAKAHEGEIIEAASRLYAAVLNEDQLAELVAFFESPAGRLMSAQDEGLTATETMITRDTGLRVQAAARAAFCRRRLCDNDGDLGLADDIAADPPRVGVAQAPWAQRPSTDDIYAATPMLAWTLGVKARARLVCYVGGQGLLQDCKVAAEAPAGLGVGAAAMALAPLYRVSLPPAGNKVFGQTVSVTVAFPQADPPKPFDPPKGGSASAVALAHQLQDDRLMRQGRAAVSRFLEQLPPKVFNNVDPETRQVALDALREAGEQVIAEEVRDEITAIAALAPEDQLTAAVAFYKSPLAATLAQTDARFAELVPKLSQHFAAVISDDARAVYCKARPCISPPPMRSQGSGNSAAPSTRTP